MKFAWVILLAGLAWILHRRSRRRKPGVKDPVQESQPCGDSGRDAWEGSFWEVQEPRPVRIRLRIGYVNAGGVGSERTVDVRQFGAYEGTVLLIGHCHLRRATRTFRVDRITQCVDETTGEVITNLGEYLETKYSQSPDRAWERPVAGGEYDVLRVLLYVGKADGQLRAPEKEIIRTTCAAITGDLCLADGMADEFLGMDVPTLQGFRLAVGRIAKREDRVRAAVQAAAEAIVATQKTVHPGEQEALDYIRKRFSDTSSTLVQS
jgi:WYL domain-containing protein